MLLAAQLAVFYPDLHDRASRSALALVHPRFSTNTFPSWELAHPYRMSAHNGEINTLRGNVNWMRARQAAFQPPLFGDDIAKLWPIVLRGPVRLRLLRQRARVAVQGGYSLAHAMMMMIPEAWAGNPLMDEERRAFYEYHAALMEPWDGPAAIAFTDGRLIGATLDRNGLRPARYIVTDDDRVDHGVGGGRAADARGGDRHASGGCSPARCCWSTSRRAGSSPTTRSSRSSRAHPYRRMARARARSRSKSCRSRRCRAAPDHVPLLERQQAFGYTQEELEILLHARWRRPARRRSARWATTRRSRRCPSGRSCSSPISSSTSPR